MCCRYYILPQGVEWDPIREGAEHARLMERFRAAGAKLTLAGEVRPTDLAPVLATDRGGGQSWFPMRWGFRLDGARGGPLINARVETAGEKPSFREAWRSHRCAVPATGYYEWERLKDGNGRTRTGTRYAVTRPGAPLLWLCGLYRIEAGLPVFVILTRPPSEALARIHDRMPLILPDQLIRDWIDPAASPEALLPLACTALRAAAQQE